MKFIYLLTLVSKKEFSSPLASSNLPWKFGTTSPICQDLHVTFLILERLIPTQPLQSWKPIAHGNIDWNNIGGAALPLATLQVSCLLVCSLCLKILKIIMFVDNCTSPFRFFRIGPVGVYFIRFRAFFV